MIDQPFSISGSPSKEFDHVDNLSGLLNISMYYGPLNPHNVYNNCPSAKDKLCLSVFHIRLELVTS
jgi:hypothetical protein